MKTFNMALVGASALLLGAFVQVNDAAAQYRGNPNGGVATGGSMAIQNGVPHASQHYDNSCRRLGGPWCLTGPGNHGGGYGKQYGGVYSQQYGHGHRVQHGQRMVLMSREVRHIRIVRTHQERGSMQGGTNSSGNMSGVSRPSLPSGWSWM